MEFRLERKIRLSVAWTSLISELLGQRFVVITREPLDPIENERFPAELRRVTIFISKSSDGKKKKKIATQIKPSVANCSVHCSSSARA